MNHRRIFFGIAILTMSVLMLELSLTRLFSATMYYHFAFMAISLAMFGLAAGAVLIEILPRRPAHETLWRTTLSFALASAVCFVAQLYIEVNPERQILNTALAFLIIAIPFVFAGMVVCVALTRFPKHTGSLYAADLAGSAAGCVLTIPILNHIHAPTAVLLNAAIAALGACAFSVSSPNSPSQPRAKQPAMWWIPSVVFVILIAPIMWASHTLFLAHLACGRTIDWSAQARHDHEVPWSLACRQFWPQTLIGLAPVLLLAVAAPSAIPYALLIAAGPLLSIPLAMVTAAPALGRALIALGLERLPEETLPPPELRALKLPAIEMSQSAS